MLVVLDGLRPDYVTPELMPNLHAWSREGIVFENHHSVFPTVTRVNASSFSTGCYPEDHGIMGNSVYFPAISATEGLTTSDRSVLLEIDRVTGGNLLTAKTLGEILEEHDKRLFVFSSGSAGSCFLLNHKVAGGAVFHHSFTLPEERRAEVLEALGPEPEEETPALALNRYAVDALIRFGLTEDHPDAIYVWLTDPDHTAHPRGMGSETTNLALQKVDEEFGRILEHLEKSGLAERTNLFVSSDHGFSTHTGSLKEDVNLLFISQGLKQGHGSGDVVVVDKSIYVKDSDPVKIQALVRAMQQVDWIGAIFTAPKEEGSLAGGVPGTFSLAAARKVHERAEDIFFSMNWTNDENEYGFKGTTTSRGVAGHGSASPWDIHNTLIAAGPDLKEKIHSKVPTGNVDIAPTFLALLGIEVPETMDGRAIREAFKNGPDPESLAVSSESLEAEASLGEVNYLQRLHRSKVADSVYFDFVETIRR
jgi:predicted AlkP superfamily pyrophosphatase or phosphodiesterase